MHAVCELLDRIGQMALATDRPFTRVGDLGCHLPTLRTLSTLFPPDAHRQSLPTTAKRPTKRPNESCLVQ
jgi:hypothetical protein